MSSQYCVICFTNSVDIPMLCGSYICGPCITEWAKSKLIMDRLSGQVTIPCPNYQCEHSLSHIDLITFLGIEMFESINEQYTQIYLSNTEDIRRCPNEECSYAGMIKMESCSDKLRCNKCSFEWREYSQLTDSQKMIKSVKDFLTFKSETFSYINEVLTGVPCPKCGLVIWKDGGCNHMVCQKCKHEFCWSCLGHYPGYNHREETFCPLRQFIIYLIPIVAFATLDYKLCSHVSLVSWIHSLFYSVVHFLFFYFLMPNILVLICFLEAIFIGWTVEGFREWSTLPQRRMAYFTSILVVVYPFTYCYLWYKILISDRFFYLASSIWYEILIVLAGVCLVLAGFILYHALRLVIRLAAKIITKLISVLSGITSKIKTNLTKIRKAVYLTKNEKIRREAARGIHQRAKWGSKLKTE
ncbi:unnamed protein product [Moneuplotes crassus]|uniref:RBR-type E3 ubiquitin transferase n=2 Tax=Euplotes crassus TaxID=5936 RepID=A0AAD1UP42_EUPCR|nr:unnamed protein product [Moneuplotes crassus]